MEYLYKLDVLCLIGFLLISYVNSSNSHVDIIGNKLHNTPATIQNQLNNSILTSAIIPKDGVLIAYGVFCPVTSPIRLQIWRPLLANHSGKIIHKLVHETKYTPVKTGKQIVYLSATDSDCFELKPGDRVGVVHKSNNGALSYEFVAHQPTALMFSPEEAQPLINDDVEFQENIFPYELSIQTYIHTDLQAYPSSTNGLHQCLDITVPDATPKPLDLIQVQGDIGERGSTGNDGLPGHQGPTGRRGPTGMDGLDGYDGVDGEDGVNGHTGATGNNGDAGNTGEQGYTGVTGEKGNHGDVGEEGPTGIIGSPGANVYIDIKETSLRTYKDPIYSSEWTHLMLVVWLCVISVVYVIVIMVTCCWIKKHKKRRHNQRPLKQTPIHCPTISKGDYRSTEWTGTPNQVLSISGPKETGDTESDLSSAATEYLDQVVASIEKHQEEADLHHESKQSSYGSLEIIVVDSQI